MIRAASDRVGFAAHAEQRQPEVVDPLQECAKPRSIDDHALDLCFAVGSRDLHAFKGIRESRSELSCDDDSVDPAVHRSLDDAN